MILCGICLATRHETHSIVDEKCVCWNEERKNDCFVRKKKPNASRRTVDAEIPGQKPQSYANSWKIIAIHLLNNHKSIKKIVNYFHR